MKKIDAVFCKLDTDGSGDVDAHELKQFFKAVNHEHSLQVRAPPIQSFRESLLIICAPVCLCRGEKQHQS